MRKTGILLGLLALGLLLALAGGGSGLPPAGASGPRGTVDSFNGGNRADLAIGVPYEAISTITETGAVNVLYGAAGGLGSVGNQMWHQNSASIDGQCETGDSFGWSLAMGDFDGDGFADLAVGVPWEDVDTDCDAGAVNVIYGSSGGLSAAGDQFWNQDTPGISDTAEPEEWFGYALAAGNFNGDRYDDLAIGVPNEQVSSECGAGAVNVLYGSPLGLTDIGDQFWNQDSTYIDDTAEAGDFFGSSLTSGDFNGDGCDDLAVGVWLEAVMSISRAGAVNIIYGSSSGLSGFGDWGFCQNSTDILDDSETGDRFGYSLASGDFDRDGFADLAVGVLYEDYDGKEDVGAVNVVYGSADGLTADGNEFWHQDVKGTEDVAEEDDIFGCSLAAGDFDGDHWSDLAVGVPGEDKSSAPAIDEHGAVHVFYGTDNGLSATDDSYLDPSVDWRLEDAHNDDRFGESLVAGDFNGDHRDDLAIGVPYEWVDLNVWAGAVQVVFGSDGGLDTDLFGSYIQFWHQNSPGIEGGCEYPDQFGYALAAVPKGTHRVRLPLVLRNR